MSFKAVQKKISGKEGLSMKAAGAILASSLLLVQFAAGQTPGTVVVGTTVTATVGTGTTLATCNFTNFNRPTIVVSCTADDGATLSMQTTPAVGSTNGSVGSFNEASQSITWSIQQPTAGVVTWSIAANGTLQSGNF